MDATNRALHASVEDLTIRLIQKILVEKQAPLSMSESSTAPIVVASAPTAEPSGVPNKRGISQISSVGSEPEFSFGPSCGTKKHKTSQSPTTSAAPLSAPAATANLQRTLIPGTPFRALIASLDSVLWEELGWKKVGMHELITDSQLKVRYVRAISKVHPDKVSSRFTFERQHLTDFVNDV